MTADFFYNVAGLLTIASRLTIAWYFWTHPGLLAKFRKDFQDALDEGRGPPESPAWMPAVDKGRGPPQSPA
jgi:hypothetical protein